MVFWPWVFWEVGYFGVDSNKLQVKIFAENYLERKNIREKFKTIFVKKLNGHLHFQNFVFIQKYSQKIIF